MLIFLFILLTGIAGFRLKSLTISGAIAAIIVGCAVFAGFGVRGLIVLGIFFVTSSLWSKYKSSLKTKMEEKLEKGATRDWRQVFANGGTAGLLGILYSVDANPIWIIAFAIAISSANSDTWASEIGSLSKAEPMDIRTFKRVEKGTSGAVSLLGSSAGVTGSLLIALFSYWLFHLSLLLCVVIFLFGYAGNIIDTLLGAYYQQQYICTCCGVETEKRVHCFQPTQKIKGIAFMDNDMVNFLSGFLAVLAALGFMELAQLI